MACLWHRVRTVEGLLGVAGPAVVALALLWFATPRFIANVVMFGAAGVQQRLQSGQEVGAEEAEFAASVYQRAHGWFEDPAWQAEWGRIQLEAGLGLLAADAAVFVDTESEGYLGEVGDETALDPSDNQASDGDEIAGANVIVAPSLEEAYEAIENAITSFEAALARRPSDAETWYQLAYARLLLEPSDAQGWQALVTSIQGAPASPSLVLERLEFAFWQWDAIDMATYEELPEQYIRALELDPETFADIVEAYDRSDDVWPIVLPWLETRLRDDAAMGWPF